MSALQQLTKLSLEADDDWSRELVKKYGKTKAGSARYDYRGTATPLLSALHDRKRQLDALRQKAWNEDHA